ncbi:YycH family regulatory protein [Niallia sp. 03133]|uniref:YycH family regulatory protein n=1 Tax=Niallia sp. 03133 TaxID=3458060 RepID=UPI0040439F3B
MTYESIKTVILSILVLISICLYYVLWTHQGNYEKLDKSPTIEPEKIGLLKQDYDIVVPDKMYQHLNGQHYGTMSSKEINDTVNTIKKWDFKNIKKLNISSASSFIREQSHSMEIRFPADVPFSLYKSFLNIKENNIFDFDTILISYDLSSNKEGLVYFVSRASGKVYSSTVSASQINGIKKITNHVTEENTVYAPYFPYIVSTNNILYLPINETVVENYKYLYKTIDSSKLKRALFRYPSLVQKSLVANREEFTDDTGLLRIDKDTHVVSYLKPSGMQTSETMNNQLIQNSINYVNQHGGWISQYRYIGKSESMHKVLFRLYNPAGYPVFNLDNKVSEIQVIWANNDVKNFMTSNIDPFDAQIDSSETTLITGEEVRLGLEKSIKDYKKEKLQDIVIGYEMVVESQSLVNLIPCWYYKYNDGWYQWKSSNVGGKEIGLE